MGDERLLPGSAAVVVTPAHWKANHLLGGPSRILQYPRYLQWRTPGLTRQRPVQCHAEAYLHRGRHRLLCRAGLQWTGTAPN